MLSVECLKNIASSKNIHCQLILVGVVMDSIKILLIRRMVNIGIPGWCFLVSLHASLGKALEKEIVLLSFTFERIKR